jgi:hypothetical protein
MKYITARIEYKFNEFQNKPVRKEGREEEGIGEASQL